MARKKKKPRKDARVTSKPIDPKLVNREALSGDLLRTLEHAEKTAFDVKGLALPGAEKLCRERGLELRIVSFGDERDRNHAITDDLRIGRVNVRLKKDVVQDADVF
ncbi:MAG TPA: hypothetical protein VFF73_37580 [Planctomycetota bacterium]|nr:hypothetical protein [Planctomycetota bacterium]